MYTNTRHKPCLHNKALWGLNLAYSLTCWLTIGNILLKHFDWIWRVKLNNNDAISPLSILFARKCFLDKIKIISDTTKSCAYVYSGHRKWKGVSCDSAYYIFYVCSYSPQGNTYFLHFFYLFGFISFCFPTLKTNIGKFFRMIKKQRKWYMYLYDICLAIF